MKLIILGAPGAGKGTQAKFIAAKHELAHISTGDILRKAVETGTEIGKKAQEYISVGKLVPDEIIIELTNERLMAPDCEHGFILDGFPRTLNQAKEFHRYQDIDVVLNIKVDTNALIKRVTGRSSCSVCGAVFHIYSSPPMIERECDECGGELIQRPDDTEEILKERLQQYHELTEPLIEYYKDLKLLLEIDGDGDIEEIQANIKEQLSRFVNDLV